MEPKQLVRQRAEIEEIERAIAAEKNPPAPPDPEETEEPETPEHQQLEPEPLADPPVDYQSELEKAEQRYRTLEGKYRNEVPRMAQEVRELKQQLESATSRLNDMAQQRDTPRKEAPKPQVTAEDAANFGADMVDFVKRQAHDVFQTEREEFQTEIQSLKAENAQLRQELTGVEERQTTTAQQSLYTQLSAAVPDWEAMNTDQEFLGWLNEHPPGSAHSRMEWLQHAEANSDAKRVIEIFQSYKQLKQPPPAPKQPSPPQNVQRQVAPGRSKSQSSTPTEAEETTRLYTGAEIEKFYSDVRAGKYKNRDADRQRLEQAIDLAVQQGRIR